MKVLFLVFLTSAEIEAVFKPDVLVKWYCATHIVIFVSEEKKICAKQATAGFLKKLSFGALYGLILILVIVRIFWC
jgi:hypothetical protein